jgi:ribosomal protein L16 Arg81 hydroxylase
MMIDEVEGISVAEFKRHFQQQLKPCVIRGGVKHWPAVGKWNLDYLARAIRPKSIRLKNNQSGQRDYQFPAHIEALKVYESGGPLPAYLTNANLYRFFPELAADVEPYSEYGLPDMTTSPLVPRNFMYDRFGVELLLGSKGHGFGVLHVDSCYIHAFIAQIHGEKDFIVFPPDQGKYLYPGAGNPLVSDVDNIWSPDLKRFPDVQKACGEVFTLYPGDLLFIASGWWHTTRMNTTSIGVTFNSVTPSNWGVFCTEALRQMALTKPGKAKLATVYLKLAKYPALWTAPGFDSAATCAAFAGGDEDMPPPRYA